MKKYICLSILCLVVLTTNLMGQDFKAGVKASALLSQVDGDEMSGYNKLGFFAGLYAEKPLTKADALQFELLYSLKGSSISSSKNTNFRPEISAQYVDLGFYYKHYFSSLGLRLGLMPSILISHKETLNGYEIQENNINAFRPFTAQVSVGLDYFFSENWFVDATFNYSFISLRKGDVEFHNMHLVFENGQYYNYLTIGMGYQF